MTEASQAFSPGSIPGYRIEQTAFGRFTFFQKLSNQLF